MTEEFDKYVKEILELLGDDDPLQVLSDTVDELSKVTESAPTSSFENAPAPGEWSARQTLQHLADTELVYGVRLRMIVTQDCPVLVGIDQDAWGSRFKDLDESDERTYQRWRMLRESNLRLLRSLSADEWSRVGDHSERGEESARYMVSLLAGHDRAHLDQMKRALSG